MGTWTAAQRRNFKATMRAKKEEARLSAPVKDKLTVRRFPREVDAVEELQTIAEIVKLYGKLSQAGINYLKSRL